MAGPDGTREFRITSLLVFLSGVSGLMIEVVFTRRLVEIFGSTSEATATVLAAFMAGFALGSALLGRRADRVARPFRLYAALEAAIGISAVGVYLLIPRLIPLFQRIHDLTGRSRPLYGLIRFGVLFALLVIPTTGMGSTLPVLVRGLFRGRQMERVVGVIYAINTAGAVCGTLLAGFACIEFFGLTRTVFLAASLNCATALAAAWLLGKVTPSRATEAPREALDLRRLALLATFVAGFTSLAYEVIWTRLLLFYITGTTYAFSIMLATFLFGIALGSYLFGRFGRHQQRHDVPVALSLALAALLAVVVQHLLGSFAQGRLYPRPEGPSWLQILLIHAGESLLLMFLPALLIGGTFPLVCRMAATGSRSIGRDTGRVYAVNTIGGILGSLAAGFLLIPLLGLSGAAWLLAGLLAATAGAVLWKSGSRTLAPIPVLLLVSLVPIVGVRGRSLDLAQGERALFYREGSAATVAVVEEQSGERRLLIDNIFVAGTHPLMMTDQKSLAHFPCLLHESPKRILTVGFGSGGASYSFSLYREVERVDCVEIVPDVPIAARFFASANHGILENPKFHLILDDARSYLSLDRGERYDVIASDCTDLSYRANADLYQRDFFALCKKRLNAGGIMCVWLPLRHLSHDDFATALASFHASFPHGSLWYMLNIPSHYVLLIGRLASDGTTDAPVRMDLARVRERLARPAIRADLAEIALTSPYRLASCQLLGAAGLERFTRGARLHTEDRPRLEFTVPRYNRGREREYENLEEMMPVRLTVQELLPDEARRHPNRISLEEAIVRALLKGHVELLQFQEVAAYRLYGLALKADPEAPDLKIQIVGHRKRYQGYAALRKNLPVYWLDQGNIRLAEGRYRDAETAYLRVPESLPEYAESLLGAAVCRRLLGQGNASQLLSQALASGNLPREGHIIARTLLLEE